MFSKATANFVRQVDPEGSLIHVSRVNDSHKLLPMAVVVKRNRLWPWQRPKYQPTDFTLGDLLQGDEVLRPGVSETEFLTYKGTYRDDHSGKLDTEAGPVNVSLEGLGASKLESCFGKLKKEELDVKKLLKDSESRLVDMQHILVLQLEKRAEVLTVVTERILTTNSCSVTMTKKQQCTFQGVLGLMGLLGGSMKVVLKDVNNIEVDSDVSLEIPSGTVIAYSIKELKIEKDGHQEICLRPSAIGGFQSDSIPFDGSLDTVDDSFDGPRAREDAPFTVFHSGWSDMDLSPLADLPGSTRCELMDKLREALRDRFALSYLQSELEKLCDCETAETPIIGEKETIPTSSCVPECVPTGFSSHLPSVYLLVSAMEELPDETLNILSNSRPDFLSAVDVLGDGTWEVEYFLRWYLLGESLRTIAIRQMAVKPNVSLGNMHGLKESGGNLSILSLPAPLQDNQVFQQAEQLLGSIRVTLRRDADQLRVEMGNTDGALALLLSLSVHGLALLCTGVH